METQEKINPIQMQIEQVKLANQTAQVIMRDCPQHILDSLKTHFETYTFTLQMQASHIEDCEYNEAEKTCKCGFVHPESMVVRYRPRTQNMESAI
jgi:hypothetical protein